MQPHPDLRADVIGPPVATVYGTGIGQEWKDALEQKALEAKCSLHGYVKREVENMFSLDEQYATSLKYNTTIAGARRYLFRKVWPDLINWGPSGGVPARRVNTPIRPDGPRAPRKSRSKSGESTSHNSHVEWMHTIHHLVLEPHVMEELKQFCEAKHISPQQALAEMTKKWAEKRIEARVETPLEEA